MERNGNRNKRVTWVWFVVVTLFDWKKQHFCFDIRLVLVVDRLVAGHRVGRSHDFDDALHARVAGHHHARHVWRYHEPRGCEDSVFDLRQSQVLSHFQLVAARTVVLQLLVLLLAVLLVRVVVALVPLAVVVRSSLC